MHIDFTLEQKRTLKLQSEKNRRREGSVGDVVASSEKFEGPVDRLRYRHDGCYPHASTARLAMTPTRWARYSALASRSEITPTSWMSKQRKAISL